MCVFVFRCVVVFFPGEIKHLSSQHNMRKAVLYANLITPIALFYSPTTSVSFREFSTVGEKKGSKFIFFLRCFLKNEKNSGKCM